MLGIDERNYAAERLGFSENLQCERGFTAGLRAIDLDDAAAGHATNAKGGIERECAGGDGADVEVLSPIAVLHDGAFAELRFDLVGGDLEHLEFFVVHARVTFLHALCEMQHVLLYERLFASQAI